MANIVNGTSTGSGGLITTGDSSDELQLQTVKVISAYQAMLEANRLI